MSDIAVDVAFNVIYEELTNFFNTAVIDYEGKWRSNFAQEVMLILKRSMVPFSGEDIHPRPTFSVGLPTALEETCDTQGGDSDLEKPHVSASSSPLAPDALDELGNLGLCQNKINLAADLINNFENMRDLSCLNDREILKLLDLGFIKHRDLEVKLGYDHNRAIHLRRCHLCTSENLVLSNLPYESYDYSLVYRACCENIVGYIPIPIGFAGPLIVNGKKYMIPLATTEGALIASINRGCKTLTDAKGVLCKVYADGMTRAPVLKFKTIMEALEVKEWLEDSQHFKIVKETFDATSNYCRLKSINLALYGSLLFVRFEATTGDAMGMNMVSKGVNEVLHMLAKRFSHMEVLSVSGNYCVDKKASSINWTNGRGKSVVAEAFVPKAVVCSVLKTTVKSLCTLAKEKLLIGTSMAGTIGGWNAHAANIVAAMFLATGQDAAQIVSSSMCLTSMEETGGGDLHVTCTMRCLEVGTVGGGTILPAQKACLKVLNCEGASKDVPGNNAKRLAEVICGTVLAGELSLMAALCTDDLVKHHLRLNRSAQTLSHPAPCPRRPTFPTINERTGLFPEDTSHHGEANLLSSNRNPDKLEEDALGCSAIL